MTAVDEPESEVSEEFHRSQHDLHYPPNHEPEYRQRHTQTLYEHENAEYSQARRQSQRGTPTKLIAGKGTHDHEHGQAR